MITVYVAGAMNGKNIETILRNLQRGIYLAGKVLENGFAPFCPHSDALITMVGGDDLAVPSQRYNDYTMEFLTRCDCVLVCSHSEESIGTIEEIKKAEALNLPIFYTLEELLENKQLISNRMLTK